MAELTGSIVLRATLLYLPEPHLDRVVDVVGVGGDPNRGCTGPDVNRLYPSAHEQPRFVGERLCMAKDGQLTEQKRHVCVRRRSCFSHLVLSSFEPVPRQCCVNPLNPLERALCGAHHADAAVRRAEQEVEDRAWGPYERS